MHERVFVSDEGIYLPRLMGLGPFGFYSRLIKPTSRSNHFGARRNAVILFSIYIFIIILFAQRHMTLATNALIVNCHIEKFMIHI